MIYALTEKAMRHAEERAVAATDVTLADLMERAGSMVAVEVALRVPYGAVAVVAGKGNNGGDGWVAARKLQTTGRSVHVFTPAEPDALGGIAGAVALAAVEVGVTYSVVEGPLESDALVGNAAVVDALFGLGFRGPVRQPYVTWIEAINASNATVVAVDMPSGMETDTGTSSDHVVHADVTLTFAAPKVGLLIHPGAEYAGQVMVVDIGIPYDMLGTAGDAELWNIDDYAPLLPRPALDVHKNSRGRVLVVAGSGIYPGAAVLAALGAQRMGAGYVTLAVPESILPIMQTKLTSIMAVGLPENPSHTFASKAAEEISDLAKEFDAVVLGPGITLAHGTVLMARKLAANLATPLVIDADGLNALVGDVEVLAARSAPTVITPHPGELARLLTTTSTEIQADRLSSAAKLSGPQCTCVLKGAHSVVSGRDRIAINTSGNPGLATAGTGDVLAGMVGALLAQGMESFEAGALAAYLHGRAGDYAAYTLTSTCMTAEDVLAHLPHAVEELLGEEWV